MELNKQGICSVQRISSQPSEQSGETNSRAETIIPKDLRQERPCHLRRHKKAGLSGQKAEYYERREAENQLSSLRSLAFTLSTVGSYKSSKQGNDIEFTQNYFSCYVKNGLYRLNMEFRMLVP